MKQQTKEKKRKANITNKTKKLKLVKHTIQNDLTPDLTDDENLLLEIRKVFNMSHEGHNFNIFLMMKNIKTGVYITPAITYKKGIISFCKKYNLHYKNYDSSWEANNTTPTTFFRCFISTNTIVDDFIIDNRLQHEIIGKFLGYDCIKNLDDDTNDISIGINIIYNFKHNQINNLTPPYYQIYGFGCYELTRETLQKLKEKRKAINKIGKNFPNLMPGFKCSIKGQFNIL